MTYNIKILDKNGLKIGELMTAGPMDVLKFITKGFVVIDQTTGQPITENMINSQIGVSDGMISL
jgi:hypothetical protein